jgi:hypothetical protein
MSEGGWWPPWINYKPVWISIKKLCLDLVRGSWLSGFVWRKRFSFLPTSAPALFSAWDLLVSLLCSISRSACFLRCRHDFTVPAWVSAAPVGAPGPRLSATGVRFLLRQVLVFSLHAWFPLCLIFTGQVFAAALIFSSSTRLLPWNSSGDRPNSLRAARAKFSPLDFPARLCGAVSIPQLLLRSGFLPWDFPCAWSFRSDSRAAQWPASCSDFSRWVSTAVLRSSLGAVTFRRFGRRLKSFSVIRSDYGSPYRYLVAGLKDLSFFSIYYALMLIFQSRT